MNNDISERRSSNLMSYMIGNLFSTNTVTLLVVAVTVFKQH
jgi:hypothetical protein